MIYILSMFPCVIDAGEKIELKADIKYAISDIENKVSIVYGLSNELPFAINFYELIYLGKPFANAMIIELGSDKYVFLTPRYSLTPFYTTFKFASINISITLSEKLLISADDELLCEHEVNNIIYSHYVIKRDYLIIYFTGKENYVLLINKNKQLLYAGFYHEFNHSEQDLLFMCRLKDSLNHGLVNRIDVDKNEHEKYLVYIDNNDLKLKQEFISFVFLDCIIAGNTKYANNLLSEDLKLEKAEAITRFFPQFNNYLYLKDETFALIKKNTLAGIYKFATDTLEIRNIIDLS